MTMLPPYYYKNREWYTRDENGKHHLTDKAPKKARDSFIVYWGSSDPRKRSIFYFLSNPEWYTVCFDIDKIKDAYGAFHLTEKAPPEARWSIGKFYENGGRNPRTGKWYFMTNPRWYTKTKDGDYVLTDEATPAAKGSYLEYKVGGIWRCGCLVGVGCGFGNDLYI